MSVHDKTGVVAMAQHLVEGGYTIIATSRTHWVLQDAGIPNLMTVRDFTGVAESVDRQVETIHPSIFSSILARDTSKPRIEVVVCVPDDTNITEGLNIGGNAYNSCGL